MEIIINNDCDYEKFYLLLSKSEEIGFKIVNKVDGFDTIYVDIEYNNTALTLCYNVYEGITIFTNSSEENNDDELILNEIAVKLKV